MAKLATVVSIKPVRGKRAPKFTPNQESAALELRRQFHQGYALVSGAMARLRLCDDVDTATIELLELAMEVLGEHEYLNRLAPAEAVDGQVANLLGARGQDRENDHG